MAPHSRALDFRLTERIDIWEPNPIEVSEIKVKCPNEFRAWASWVHRFNSRLRLYNSDLMLASLYCWERRVFPFALVEVEAGAEGCVREIACCDDEWALDYDLPPLEIMQVRLGGLSRIDPKHGRHTALEVIVDGREYELDESGGAGCRSFANIFIKPSMTRI